MFGYVEKCLKHFLTNPWANMGPCGPKWAHVNPYAPNGLHMESFGLMWAHIRSMWAQVAHMRPYGRIWDARSPAAGHVPNHGCLRYLDPLTRTYT
jgi:hypothetical protein